MDPILSVLESRHLRGATIEPILGEWHVAKWEGGLCPLSSPSALLCGTFVFSMAAKRLRWKVNDLGKEKPQECIVAFSNSEGNNGLSIGLEFKFSTVRHENFSYLDRKLSLTRERCDRQGLKGAPCVSRNRYIRVYDRFQH